MEVLIAGFILVILLSLLTSFLVQQRELGVRTQARSEAQDKARVVMHIVTQDLQLSGARYFVDGNGDIVKQLGTCATSSAQPTCFVAVDDGLTDKFGSVYITTTRGEPDTDPSLHYAEACRRVFYSLAGSDLLRADLQTSCSSPGTADPGSSDAGDEFAKVEENLLASNIVAFNVIYRCSNGRWIESYPDAGCPQGSSYLRSAVVSVYAASDDSVEGAPADSFSLVTVDAGDDRKTATDSEDCPADRICLGLTQEVLLPNLKK